MEKVDIIQNAIDLAHIIGTPEPKVAILSAVETVNPKIQSTLDAAALCKMADRGQITRRAARRPAGLRQRHLARRRQDQGNQVGGGRPEQEISAEVLIEKYAKGAETNVHDVRRRVFAKALAANEEEKQRANPCGKSVSCGRRKTASSPPAASTPPPARRCRHADQLLRAAGRRFDRRTRRRPPGIYSALAEAAETMRRGGGVGYDFSSIRPIGAQVKGTQSRASGPVSYMRVFDRSCETVESAGARRGAQMGVLRCDHPDIEESSSTPRTTAT
jgi:hypothetical protein